MPVEHLPVVCKGCGTHLTYRDGRLLERESREPHFMHPDAVAGLLGPDFHHQCPIQVSLEVWRREERFDLEDSPEIPAPGYNERTRPTETVVVGWVPPFREVPNDGRP